MKEKFKSKYTKLYQGDSLKLLKKFDSETFDVIITDPPYFLSNDGISCQNGKMVSVNKGDWDKLDDGMSSQEFYLSFLTQAKRILKPNGTIFIFGTLHNIYLTGYLLEKLNFKILNNITWEKTNPAPNLSCRMFTHSTETILWAKKSKKAKHYFNYDLMRNINSGKQMKDVWTSSTTKKSEKKFGKHPTQKPMWLLERIILASTKEGDLILDCFSGSGTTLLAAEKLKRNSVGIEILSEYIDLTIKRIKNINEPNKKD